MRTRCFAPATLRRLADAYAQHTPELVETHMLENEKLRPQAPHEVHFIPRALRYAAGLAIVQAGRVAQTMPGHQSMAWCRQRYHPVELARLPVSPLDRASARGWMLS